MWQLKILHTIKMLLLILLLFLIFLLFFCKENYSNRYPKTYQITKKNKKCGCCGGCEF